MKTTQRADRYKKRNDSMRLERYEAIDDDNKVIIRAFLREIDLPHLYEEHFVPVMEAGDACLFAAVRDRPWPPWGLGGQRIHALCLAAPSSDDCVALTPVFTLGNDATNLGVSASVLKEVLDYYAEERQADVCYPVIEDAVWVDRVLTGFGFEPSEEMLLTDAARYNVYRANPKKLEEALGLEKVTTLDILDHDLDDETFRNSVIYHSTVVLATLPGLLNANINRRPEIIIWGGGGLGASCPAECLPS